MNSEKTHDVIIIGAGAAGVGLGVLFEKMGLNDYVILERDTIGRSFKQWPSYTRFISPSFTGNAFNAVDLNAISPDTSPAHSHKTEHLSGKQYAEYLELVAKYFKPKIAEQTNVTKIEKVDDMFLVTTSKETFRSRYLVSAIGEFQHPFIPSIPGAELCQHSSTIKDFAGNEATIIGGYESGMDIAKEALQAGKAVTIIDANTPWAETSSDSSISVSPYTQEKIRPYAGSKQLTLLGNTRVTKITKDGGGYELHTDKGEPIRATEPPILATGFASLPPLIAPHFANAEDGSVDLTEDDESTITSGLFLIGPKVQHGAAIFCFIYKFRQRLPIVAEAIADGLGLDLDVPEEYLRTGMYLKDISACGDECTC